jgi:two-component system, NarL family, sensor histidine kinase BarA
MQDWQKQLIEGAGDILFLLTADGVIQHMNPAGCELLNGGSHNDVRPLQDFVEQGSAGAVRMMLQQVSHKQSWTGDVGLRGHNGAIRMYNIHAYPAPDNGKGNGILGIARDVTQRCGQEVRWQEEAARKELAILELEEANQLKSEFLSNTSHELRTPLNSIIGFLGVIRDGLTESREEELDLISNALQSSNHLLGLINDVLDIAKIEAGRMTLNLAPMRIKDVMEEVMVLTRVQADQKHLKYLLQEGLAALPPIVSDYGKLKQVLINVVGNAIKFTERGGVSIKAQPTVSGDKMVITVSDTGIGIEPHDLQMIFRKFSQVDSSFTRTRGGTGLGLSISKSLMEMLKGTISVESDGHNKGTTIRITLPTTTEVPAESNPYV